MTGGSDDGQPFWEGDPPPEAFLDEDDAAPAPEPPRELPTIKIQVGEPQRTLDAAIVALRADQNLYTRDSDLAHVARVSRAEVDEYEGAVVVGTPAIYTMTLSTLRVRMCEVAHWKRTKMTRDGFEEVPCEPTRAHAEELRDQRDWPGLRPLTGISETPFPRPDGNIVQGAAHYDRATGYLFEPAEKFPLVADAPTQDDARASFAALLDLFVDFPFATPAGGSAAVAAIVTLVCRPAIRGPVPAYIIDATAPGTGKTLMADVISAVALGRESGRAHFPATTGRDADAELGKRLGMLARMGAPLVNFDNADEAIIGGDVLEEVISARDKYMFRILGKTEGLNLPVRTVFLVTANNATWSRGMNRRILHIRLESPLENPEHRAEYVHPERGGRLFEFAIEHRAEYVAHVLTLVRAYIVAGRPSPLKLGTFEAWSGLVASAIVWAGGVDPMLCRPSQSGEESPDVEQARALVREWAAFCTAAGLSATSATDAIDALYPKREHGEPLDAKWGALRDAIEYFAPPRPGQDPDAKKLGDVITKRFKGTAVRTHSAPAPLLRFAKDGASHGRARWRVEAVPAVSYERSEAASAPA